MTRKMKNSNIDWIGEIPENWCVLRIKNVAKLYNGNSISDKEKEKYEDSKDAIPYIATKDINSLHKIDYSNGMYVKSFYLKDFKIAPKNSTLMCIEGGSAGIKKAKLNQDVCFVNKLCCFAPNKINDNYLYYFLNTSTFELQFKSKLSGLISGVSISELKTMNCHVPPLPEQQKIAAFLDDKCGVIDEIISKTEQTIEEYQKLKQSVITKAVTKGIRSNRKMKDSNIEWIGEIPENWLLSMLKRYVKVNNGKEIESEVTQADKNSVGVYGSGGIFKYTDVCLYDGEAVMFGRKGTLGQPLYVNGKFWTVDTMYYLTYKKKLLAKYNYYQLYAFDWEHFVTHTAIPSIVATDIVAQKFPLPSLSEQKEIAQYLDEKCIEIDVLIEKKQQFLAEMANYKKSLIYEYVTGKKEVV